MKKIIMLCFFFWNCLMGWAQDKSKPYAKRWLIASTFGANFSAPQVSNQSNADILITHRSNALAWQGLRVDYYFLKHFGVYGQIRANGIKAPSSQQLESIYSYFKQELEGQYFLLNRSGNELKQLRSNRTGSTKGTFGMLYRWENDFIYLSGGLGLSFHATAVYEDSFRLKEKATNNYFEVNYKQISRKGDGLGIVSLDAAVSYKVWHWFWIRGDVGWSSDRYDFSIDRNISNINTKESETLSMPYKGKLSNLYFGLGLAFALR